MTEAPGALPDFLIVGAQRSGTSSLYAYLTKHPQIRRAAKKEAHFFDVDYGRRSVEWYRSFFPTPHSQSSRPAADSMRLLTGEATPYYLFHPCVPRRVAKLLPRVKLLAILRDPVDRAYSHYQMEVGNDLEHLSFEEAIEAESARLDGEAERLLADDEYWSAAHCHYSYLARGVYADQLLRWRAFFPLEQMLILRAEDLRTGPAATLQKALDFLGVPGCELRLARSRNVREYPPMNSATRERLKEYFEPHNRRLYDLIGSDLVSG
ncbi:MAG: sulfotransferase domain-containing protein [Actinomycetota bacterium]|nr:sulfotransferase domain-containing protein [Actinomycetota bacterium]